MAQNSAPLTQEDALAIRSATAPVVEAVQCWKLLLADTDFQLINPNTQRLAPMIYHHLKSEPDIRERERLRGAYKYAWAKNLRMLNSLRTVFAEMNSQSINYRVIKGIAVQLELGLVGARVVGDVDIVVSELEIDTARQILEKRGFRCNSVSPCKRHTSSAPFEALNFNSGDNHVDVHVAELKDPKLLLQKMLESEPRIIEHMGVGIKVPEAELLLLHSAFHGHQAVSDTDLVQAIADISLLAMVCKPRKLEGLAKQTKSHSDLWHVSAEAKTIDLIFPEIGMEPRNQLVKSAQRISSGAKSLSGKAAKVPAIIHDRHRGNSTLRHVLGQFPGRRGPYALWLGLGQFSAIERAASTAKRGFLRPPTIQCPAGKTLMPFSERDSDFVTASNLVNQTLDYRFSVRIESDSRELCLTLDSEFLDSSDAFVYCNGRPITRIVAGDSSYKTVTIRNPSVVNEISIRPTSRVCSECFRSLSDLKIRISYE